MLANDIPSLALRVVAPVFDIIVLIARLIKLFPCLQCIFSIYKQRTICNLANLLEQSALSEVRVAPGTIRDTVIMS